MNYSAAISLGLLKRSQHARMVCARILPDDENRLRLIKILEQDSSLAHADRLVERSAT